MGTMDNTYVIN